jgi:hypothetical protein
MTVLSIAQHAALVLGLNVPQQVYGSPDRDSVELGAMLNSIRPQIRDEFDWQNLVLQATITGDGETESFDLPSDYYRMLKDTNLYNSDIPGWQVRHIQDTDEWLRWKVSLVNPFARIWTLFGQKIHIRPIMQPGSTVLYYYIRDTDVRDTDNQLKAEFTADTDEYVLNAELLELALIWNWKAAKTLPYSKELNDYEVKLAALTAANRGNRIIRTGVSRFPRGADVAYPWPLGI